MPAPSVLAWLRALLAPVMPRPGFWLGKAHRVTIHAAACGGYALKLHRAQGVEWIDLPLRTEPYGHPDEREFTAAFDALTARGLVWVLPWGLDHHGNLTAPVASAEDEASPQRNPLVDPGPTPAREDRS